MRASCVIAVLRLGVRRVASARDQQQFLGLTEPGGQNTVSARNLEGGKAAVVIAGNTFNTGSDTGDCNGAASGTRACQSRRAIDLQVDDSTIVSGTITINGNTITNVVRAGIIFDVTEVHLELSPRSVIRTAATFRTVP